MVDVPHSSSGASSSASPDVRSFDVSNEADLLALLSYIRTAPIEDSERTVLRDTILDFSETKSTKLLHLLASELHKHGVELHQDGQPIGSESAAPPVTPEEAKSNFDQPVSDSQSAVPAAATNQSGLRRPKPHFGASVAASATEAKEVSVPETAAVPVEQTPAPASAVPEENVVSDTPAPVAPVTEAPQPSNESEASQTDASKPVAAEPVATAEPATATAESSIPAEPKTAAEPVAEAPTATAPTDSEPPHHTSASAVLDSLAPNTNPHLQRIKEIKRLVNEKVGNPVNLIDVNNEIGREYMNALLQAMKVVNGGTPDEVALAMDRLEKAYSTIEASISSGEIKIGGESTVDQDLSPTPVAAPEPTSETPEPEEPVKPETSMPDTNDTLQSVEPTPAVSSPAPAPSSQPEEAAAVDGLHERRPAEGGIPLADIPTIPAASPDIKLPVEPEVEPEPQPAPEPSPAPTPKPVPAAPSSPQPAAAASATPPTPATPAMSVADTLAADAAKRAEITQEHASENAEAQAAAAADPLLSPEVTNGLKQLLSEWKLFKGGGIFGTGPSGMENALYKNLAPLPMAAVIANRFEGASPEVKQSITDYMNGWRYEQGVVHEMNETFEHYLRRVIRAILDRKKGEAEA